MIDLFGLEQQTKRTNSKPEAAALCEVMKALKAHPAVSWAERQNTGSARIGGRFVRFGWPGCSDVIGMLTNGKFLAVEVKGPAGRLRPEQAVFLERINKAGGVAFVARGCRDVMRWLDTPKEALHPVAQDAPPANQRQQQTVPLPAPMPLVTT